jgi:hypothetical protein
MFFLEDYQKSGHTLGFYYDIAEYMVFIPVGLLLVAGLIYNVLVAVASVWMYQNAWKRKSTNAKKMLVFPAGVIWEEIYVVNIKISNYLLGGSIALKEDDGGYLKLLIHDTNLFMPLAMILIQVSQLAVAMTLVVLFMDYLLLQISNTCGDGKDCFALMDLNRSSTPIDCSDVRNLHNLSNITCFELRLNPTIAAAVTGGFLKITPHILFSSITYLYMRFLSAFKCLNNINVSSKIKFIFNLVIVIFLEIGFIGAGIAVLMIFNFVPSVNTVTFHVSNPIKTMTYVFGFVMYFAMASALWCLRPDGESNYFHNGIWKKFNDVNDEDQKLLEAK